MNIIENIDKEAFATNLKRLREKKNLTQEDFAEMYCISARSYQKWEGGETLPQLDNFFVLAYAFNVSPFELIKGENKEMNDYTKRIREELSKIQDPFIIKTIHDSNLTSSILPYLDLSEELISSIQETWNDNHIFYENGKKSVCYAPYVSQTIIKYCQNRDKFKRQYSL